MSKLVQIINSPFWAAGILTVILLTTGDYKWLLFGLYVLFAFFGKLYYKKWETLLRQLCYGGIEGNSDLKRRK